MFAVKELREEIYERLRSEGVALVYDPAALARLEGLARRIQAILPGNVLDRLDCLFVFHEAEQAEEMRGYDGWIWWFYTPGGKLYTAIGLAVEVLEGDENYCTLVLLHELAHLRSGEGHTAAFAGCLDRLILQYNRATGSNIENDYVCILRPGQNFREDAAAKEPRIGQKRRGWPIGK